MSVPEKVVSILPRLDDEVFYGLLDVVLDVDNELTVGNSNTVSIEGTRQSIRFQILYPVHSVDSQYRYLDLRGKAILFLQKHGLVESMDYHKYGLSGWQGKFEIKVRDPSEFPELLTCLEEEASRRNSRYATQTDESNTTARLLQLAESFHRVVLRLRDRRKDREPILVKDEYDVQYVFAALLETRFDDVRPEEWGPSYAGSATRVDFLLKKESVLVETKMTRDGLTDRKLGEELIIDIAHYKQREIKSLVCFVYDPDHRLKNPTGIENDLSKPTDGLDVRVLIRPKS